MPNNKRKKYLEKLKNKDSLQRTKEDRLKICFPILTKLKELKLLDIDEVKPFIKIIKIYINEGKSFQGKIELHKYSREIWYTFYNNKKFQSNAILKYIENT